MTNQAVTGVVKKVLLVSDLGDGKHGDLAVSEVRQRITEEAAAQGITVAIDDIATLKPFDSTETAALIAAALDTGEYDLIAQNTAPRFDAKGARKNNAGEKLVHMPFTHANGKQTDVIGVYAGNNVLAKEEGRTADRLNTFAFFSDRPGAGELREVDCASDTTQFRSRDVFPKPWVDSLTGNLRLREQSGTLDAHVNTSQIMSAHEIDERLKHARHRLAHDITRAQPYGDIEQGYLTVIAPKDTAELVAAMSTGEFSPLTDTLPTRSTRHPALEAGFMALQLSKESVFQHRSSDAKRMILYTPVGHQGNGAVTFYEAELNDGVVLRSTDANAFAYAAHEGVISQISKGKADFWKLASPRLNGERTKVPAPQLPALVEGHVVLYTDRYGNVKTSTKHDRISEELIDSVGGLAEDERLKVEIAIHGENEAKIEALLKHDGSFSLKDGEFGLTPGSSGGWLNAAGEATGKLAECFFRGGDAAKAFQEQGAGRRPEAGDRLEIRALGKEKIPQQVEKADSHTPFAASESVQRAASFLPPRRHESWAGARLAEKTAVQTPSIV